MMPFSSMTESASESDYEESNGDVDSDNDTDPVVANSRRYPMRTRTQRQIPNSIPWSSVQI